MSHYTIITVDFMILCSYVWWCKYTYHNLQILYTVYALSTMRTNWNYSENSSSLGTNQLPHPPSVPPALCVFSGFHHTGGSVVETTVTNETRRLLSSSHLLGNSSRVWGYILCSHPTHHRKLNTLIKWRFVFLISCVLSCRMCHIITHSIRFFIWFSCIVDLPISIYT